MLCPKYEIKTSTVTSDDLRCFDELYSFFSKSYEGNIYNFKIDSKLELSPLPYVSLFVVSPTILHDLSPNFASLTLPLPFPSPSAKLSTLSTWNFIKHFNILDLFCKLLTSMQALNRKRTLLQNIFVS